MLLELTPLGVALLVLLSGAFVPRSRRLSLVVTQLSLALFGEFTRGRKQYNTEQVRNLEAAHVGETYQVYASKTFFYATVVAIVGSISGVYAYIALRSVLVRTEVLADLPTMLDFLATSPEQMGLGQLFVILLTSSGTFGVIGGFLTYQFRWVIPGLKADERRRRIDATIKRNVAFIFALSRSGMAFPVIFRILSKHTGVYGETAREIRVTVKDIDLFGADIQSALSRTSDRTPSDELEEFVENLGSVLRSGRSISTFLRDQYEYFLGEEEAHQNRFIELLGTLAEAYVTVFVAGFLFLITILFVMGVLIGGTLEVLRLMIYLVLPLATLGYVIYLDTITEDLKESTTEGDIRTELSPYSEIRVSDTSHEEGRTREKQARNWYRLALARRIRPWLRKIRNPVRLLTEQPEMILALTAPVGLAWIAISWWPYLATNTLEIARFDDAFVQALLFVTGTFALTYEITNRRVKAIEASLPDFLDRLASTNEAGMSIVGSFDRVVRSDLGALSREMKQTRADIEWGAQVENALVRFRHRVETPATTRVVTLITNAMGATNDIGPVLRIAADEAKATRRLERDRRNQLVVYTVVVYISFLVFLVIVVALVVVFIPSIPTTDPLSTTSAESVPGGVGLGVGLRQLTPAVKSAYTLVLFHAGIVQGYLSGFVAGQMGEGSVKAGAKHATVMLIIAYGFMLLLG